MLAFSWYYQSDPILTLAAALNIAGFLLFGYDKAAARHRSARVPESVLLSLAAVGASPALLLGMILFRHKTRDRTFLPYFCLILGIQVLLLTYWDFSS